MIKKIIDSDVFWATIAAVILFAAVFLILKGR